MRTVQKTLFHCAAVSWMMPSFPVVVLIGVIVLASNAFGFEIVRDGKAQCVIVIPAQACESVNRAAQELQYHVKKATGVAVSMVHENTLSETSQPRLYLGNGEAAAKVGIATQNLPRNGSIIKTIGNDLFIVGRDNDVWTSHEEGTLLGVYNFLDREMGVRWLWPGVLGEVIPKKSVIDITSHDETVIPPLRSSRIHPSYQASETGWAKSENHKKFFEDETLWLQRQGFSWDNNLRSEHTFGIHKYWERFGKSHPEFFNLLPDGTRRPDPYHVCGGSPAYIGMCKSSPGLVKQIIADWKVDRNTQPDTSIWVGENDTNGSCCCPNCLNWDVPDKTLQIPWDKRLDYAKRDFAAGKGNWMQNLGNMADRYCNFYMAVYRAAKPIDPNALVIGFAYANYVKPPIKAKLNKNIVICFVGTLMYPWTPEKVREFYDDWMGWYKTGCTMVLRSNFMLDGHCMPIFTARKLGDLLQTFHANGMIGTEFDSNTGQYATRGPDMYVMARRNQEMNKTTDGILGEYYQAFGPAEAAVREYFSLWEQLADAPVTVEAYKKAQSTPVGVELGDYSGFYRIAPQIFTPEIIGRGWKILDKALAKAKDDPLAKARVEYLRKGFKNAEFTLNAQRAQESGDKFNFSKAITTLDQYRASIEGDNVANMNFLASLEERTWDRSALRLRDTMHGMRLPATWKFMWDPKDTGNDEKWYSDNLDTSTWYDISVDGPYGQQPVGKKWNEEHHGRHYLGIAWYRNTFSVSPVVPDKKYFIRLTFGAVDEACSVWVNGIKVLDRPFPYNGNADSWREPFVVDISKVVRFDRPNTLAVQVTNNSGAGGIWRPVWVDCSELPTVNANNLIQNGGFENANRTWQTSVMSGDFNFSYDKSQVHGGNFSGRIECTGVTVGAPDRWKKSWARWYQTEVPVTPGQKYRFCGWVRTDPDFSGEIRLWVIGEGDRQEVRLSGTDGLWNEVKIENIEPKSKAVGICLNMLNATGDAWFDDVKLILE